MDCEPLPCNVNAALAALGEHKRFRGRALPSDRWRASLNGAYHSTALWVLTSISDFLGSAGQAACAPAGILGACDERWMLGSLSAATLDGLRHACSTAEAAIDVSFVDPLMQYMYM